MAKVAAHGSRIWIDEFPLSGYIGGFDHAVNQELAKVDTFADAGPRRVVGNYDYTLGVTGFFDGAALAFDAQAFVNLNTDEDHILSLCPGASAEGSLGARAGLIRLASQPRSGAVGGAVLLNVDSEGSGPLVGRGTVLANADVTGAGNRTGRNMGASTSGQLFVAHFHLVAFDGTNITLKIQESSDDGGGDAYADIAGLTTGALTAIGAVRKTTTAATEAYKRVNIAGTFTSATIVVVAGVAAGY